MPLRTLRCAVEDLDGWHPRLFLEPPGVACVAVMSRYSGQPATFEVACEGISCVLEVSGTEDISDLGRRHREKVAQALVNTYGWGACVIVCAFSAKGHRIRVSRHGPAEA